MDWDLIFQMILPYVGQLIVDVILPVVFDVIAITVLTLGAIAINWWKNLRIEEWVKEMVVDGVLSAQEELWDRVGKEKFQFAKLYILDRLAERGIKISEDKLDALIQGTVKDLKGDFADLWYNNPPKDE